MQGNDSKRTSLGIESARRLQKHALGLARSYLIIPPEMSAVIEGFPCEWAQLRAIVREDAQEVEQQVEEKYEALREKLPTEALTHALYECHNAWEEFLYIEKEAAFFMGLDFGRYLSQIGLRGEE